MTFRYGTRCHGRQRAEQELVKAKEALERKTRELAHSLSMMRATLLVVDDEPDAREMLQAMLERCKAEVTVAASAGDALELLERTLPDVLISDIGMPGEDGYDLIRKVRALSRARGGGTPAVALTAYARQATAAIERSAMAQEKPCDQEDRGNAEQPCNAVFHRDTSAGADCKGRTHLPPLA